MKIRPTAVRSRLWWAGLFSVGLHLGLLMLVPWTPAGVSSSSDLREDTASPVHTTTVLTARIFIAPPKPDTAAPPPSEPSPTANPPLRTAQPSHRTQASVAVSASTPPSSSTQAQPTEALPAPVSAPMPLNLELPTSRSKTLPIPPVPRQESNVGPRESQKLEYVQAGSSPHPQEQRPDAPTKWTERRHSQGDFQAEVVTPMGRYCLRSHAASRMRELRDSTSFDRAINPSNCF